MGICHSSSKIRKSVDERSVFCDLNGSGIIHRPAGGSACGNSVEETILLNDDDDDQDRSIENTTTTRATTTMRRSTKALRNPFRSSCRSSQSSEFREYSVSTHMAKTNDDDNNHKAQAPSDGMMTSWGVMDIGQVQRMIRKNEKEQQQQQQQAQVMASPTGMTSWGVMDIDQVQQMIRRQNEHGTNLPISSRRIV